MQIKKIIDQPDKSKIIYLQCALMPDGDVMCGGETIDHFKDCEDYIYIEDN